VPSPRVVAVQQAALDAPFFSTKKSLQKVLMTLETLWCTAASSTDFPLSAGYFEGALLQQSFNATKGCNPGYWRWWICTAAWTEVRGQGSSKRWVLLCIIRHLPFSDVFPQGIFNGLFARVNAGDPEATLSSRTFTLFLGPPPPRPAALAAGAAAAAASPPAQRQSQRTVRIMHQEGLLPTLPPELLWPEVGRWQGSSGQGSARVWGAECPLTHDDPDFDLEPGVPRFDDQLQVRAAVAARVLPTASHACAASPRCFPLQLAAAMDHGAWAHTHASAYCFHASLAAARADPHVAPASVTMLADTVRRNIDILEGGALMPYVLPPRALAALVRENVELPPRSSLRLPRGM
jgi:hypothetical protein